MTDLIEGFADTAMHLLGSYVANGNEKRVRDWYASLLKHLCRELEDFAPRNVSQAAHDEAVRRSIPGDLRDYHWNDQHKFDKAREIFRWEHMVPVSDLFRALVALVDTKQHTDVTSVSNVLRGARIAWILKDEDARLLRYNRKDPWQAYADAKIELVYKACGKCRREGGAYDCPTHGDRWLLAPA